MGNGSSLYFDRVPSLQDGAHLVVAKDLIEPVTYQLPRFDYTNSLVPSAKYDQDPEYVIVGGLVFE
jgi:hypothetical protein